jgi:hypothetical protein
MRLRVVGSRWDVLPPLLAADAVGTVGGEETTATLFASTVTTTVFAANCTTETVA